MGILRNIFKKNYPSKDILTTLSGDFISKGFTFFVNLILLKVSSPQDFGLFAIYITYLGLGTQFADLGINQGIIKFYSFYNSGDPTKAQSFVNLGLKIKIFIAISLSTIYYLFSNPTSQYLYRQESFLLPLSIAAVGVFGGSLLDFIQSVLQGEQKYSRLAFIKILEGLLKFGGLLILILLKIFSISLLFWVYAIIPIFVFLIGFSLRKWEKVIYTFKEVFSELYNFSKWIFLASLITMIISRLDILMLSFLKGNDYSGLGIYSAGLKLGIPLLVATSSMITVYYPKAMTLRTKGEIRKYISQTMKTTIPLSIGFICFWLLIEVFVPIYFVNYIDSLPVFRILLIAYIFTLIGNPITLLMFVINKQKVATLINVLQLFINIFLNLLFYKYFDILGIAFGILLTYLIGGILTFQYLIRYFKRNAIK